MLNHHCVVFLAGEDRGDGMIFNELTGDKRMLYSRNLSLMLYIPNVGVYAINSVEQYILSFGQQGLTRKTLLCSPKHMLEQSYQV